MEIYLLTKINRLQGRVLPVGGPPNGVTSLLAMNYTRKIQFITQRFDCTGKHLELTLKLNNIYIEQVSCITVISGLQVHKKLYTQIESLFISPPT